jgi:hypothetical protein
VDHPTDSTATGRGPHREDWSREACPKADTRIGQGDTRIRDTRDGPGRDWHQAWRAHRHRSSRSRGIPPIPPCPARRHAGSWCPRGSCSPTHPSTCPAALRRAPRERETRPSEYAGTRLGEVGPKGHLNGGSGRRMWARCRYDVGADRKPEVGPPRIDDGEPDGSRVRGSHRTLDLRQTRASGGPAVESEPARAHRPVPVVYCACCR